MRLEARGFNYACVRSPSASHLMWQSPQPTFPETIVPTSLHFWHSNLFILTLQSAIRTKCFHHKKRIHRPVCGHRNNQIGQICVPQEWCWCPGRLNQNKFGRESGRAKFEIQFLEITVAIATQNLKETLGWSAGLMHIIICHCSWPQQAARAVRADEQNTLATYSCFAF